MHPDGISPAYTVDEVVANFMVLLEQMDMQHELDLLGVSKMRFRLRRRLRTELTALIIGLWRLAMVRSFPHDGDAIFHVFLEQYKEKLNNTKTYEHLCDTAEQYVARLLEQGDSDFTAVSAHLIGMVTSTPAVSMRLRIALHLRTLYTLIFDRLI